MQKLTLKTHLLREISSGIGYSAIKHLARRGAKVYMASRSETRAKSAMERLATDGLGRGEVHYLNLDLSDPCTAKAAAKEFFGRESRLDILGVCCHRLMNYDRPN